LAPWLLPSWLTQSPRSASPSEREKAVADARTGVITFLAVLGGLGGLYYTARAFRVSRDAQIDARNYADKTARMSAKTVDLNERGQITDRYAKAVEMLGNPSYEICIGGIYALGLSNSNLRGADLSASNLAGARLTVGALTPEQLAVARNRDKIIWVEREKEPRADSETDDHGPDPL
jgi:hypothetical protein